jgi:D-amino-acid oxidase
MRVLVVGAGVIGLTVGVRLAEAGYDVHVLGRELPLETTSAVAAAVWYPYRIDPVERVLPWSVVSLREFEQIATDTASGVVWRRGVEVLRQRSPDPWWMSAVSTFERVADVPAGYRDGWTFVAPVIEMRIYLRWLQERLERGGGTVTRMALPALPEPVHSEDHHTIVVNCSGIGARALSRDTTVTPVRGQVVHVAQFGLEEWTLDAAGPTYVIPRSHDIVIGGTDSEGSWETRPDPSTAREIIERAVILVPRLANAEVLAHRVGLRPARKAVRLETEPTADGALLVHCYGHGGAGVTTSWGCADDVLALVNGA